jgi:hypothetical protein
LSLARSTFWHLGNVDLLGGLAGLRRGWFKAHRGPLSAARLRSLYGFTIPTRVRLALAPTLCKSLWFPRAHCTIFGFSGYDIIFEAARIRARDDDPRFPRRPRPPVGQWPRLVPPGPRLHQPCAGRPAAALPRCQLLGVGRGRVCVRGAREAEAGARAGTFGSFFYPEFLDYGGHKWGSGGPKPKPC